LVNVAAYEHGDSMFIFGLLHVYDLHLLDQVLLALLALLLHVDELLERHLDRVDDLEGLLAVHADLFLDRDYVGVVGVHGDALAVLVRLVLEIDEEVVVVHAPINVEADLITLVSDAIEAARAEHHRAASHEVVHAILELWDEGLRVDEVEVDE